MKEFTLRFRDEEGKVTRDVLLCGMQTSTSAAREARLELRRGGPAEVRCEVLEEGLARPVRVVARGSNGRVGEVRR